jgi:hypothetical protein
MPDENILREVLASLSAQRENLPPADPAKEVYAKNYHEQIDLLEQAGYDVARFRIPSEQIQPIELIAGVVTAGVHEPTRYTEEKYIDRSLLLTKIDTVLGFFELDNKKIGFTA